MTEIVNMISSVGFPIAMCLIIMYFWNNQYSKTMQELRDTISRLTDVVADNTRLTRHRHYRATHITSHHVLQYNKNHSSANNFPTTVLELYQATPHM